MNYPMLLMMIRRIGLLLALGVLIVSSSILMVDSFGVHHHRYNKNNNYNKMKLSTTNSKVNKRFLSPLNEYNRSTATKTTVTENAISLYSTNTDHSSMIANTTNSHHSNGIDFPYEITTEALRVFYDEHSHLALPRRFLCPEKSKYPTIYWNVDLSSVYDMRWWLKHVKEQPSRVSELNNIKFIWERLQPEWNLIFESLIVYKSLYGNVLVPHNFTIPHDDDLWPMACWGIRLGSSVLKIRNRGDHLGVNNPNSFSRRKQLDSIGFVWDVQELRFAKFCNALQLFGRIEQQRDTSIHLGALNVPSQYVVPKSNRWPNNMQGYRLGERCTQIRQKELYIKGHPRRLKILADLGFYVNGGSNNSLRWLEVVHAAAVYSQMNNNSLDVPTKFVVPAPPRRVTDFALENEENTVSCVVGSNDAWPWPEYLWDFPLGRRLRDIRVKGNYLRGENSHARRRQLDALGFNWKPKRGRRCSSIEA